MFDNLYGEAAVEVLDILDNTNKEDLQKIPKSFIKFLVDNASSDYSVSFDHSKPISELNITEKAKEILGVIYINWWCDKNQKEQYKKEIEEHEKRKELELREKYNPDNIFENRKKQEDFNQRDETLAMVEYKENIFKQIINKIVKFFTRIGESKK